MLTSGHRSHASPHNFRDEGSRIKHQTQKHRHVFRAQRAAALAAIGFKRVELIGSHLDDAQVTRERLDAHGIAAPTGHVSMDALRNRPDLDGT